jgi:hypothetical protein
MWENSQAMKETDEIHRPILFAGGEGGDEGWLIGNREGLAVLRDAIEASLAVGESTITEEGIEFAGVRCRQDANEPSCDTTDSKLAGIGCVVLIVVCFLVFFYGVFKLVEKLF